MNVNIEKQSDGTYIAYNVGDESTVLIGTGDSVSEAKADFNESVKQTVRYYESIGADVPQELKTAIEYKFDLSSLFEYYNVFNLTTLAKRLGLNATLLRQYKAGNTYISERQLSKIEEGIHTLGSELASLRLV